MTVTAEGMIANPFVLDGRVLLITDYCMEEGNHMAVYTVLDREGKVLDTFSYDEYITFLDVVADKLLYFKLESDFKYELWWVEKENLKDLSQKGVRIGPDMGYELDTLAK